MSLWDDQDYTKQKFLKSLHILVKDKNEQVLNNIFIVSNQLFMDVKNKKDYLDVFTFLDISKLMPVFCEQTLVIIK